MTLQSPSRPRPPARHAHPLTTPTCSSRPPARHTQPLPTATTLSLGNIAGPQITSFHSILFHYHIDEIPWETNSYLYQLACAKTGFVIRYVIVSLKIAEPIDIVQ